MKGNRKPKTWALKEGSRAFRRRVANVHGQKKVLKGLRDLIAAKAADRPAHVARFFAVWANAVANVSGAGDVILANKSVEISEKTVEAWLEPYSMFILFYFYHLFDNLTFDEEARFREISLETGAAWQKLSACVSVRHPDLASKMAIITDAQRILQEEVGDIVLGESAAVLTPRYVDAYDGGLAALKFVAGRLKA